jgi:hypothetical protein
MKVAAASRVPASVVHAAPAELENELDNDR